MPKANKRAQKIRVRFPPSPTGVPHIGSIRTALFNYLFAKNQGGDFILRIEDTDQNRLVPGSVDQIKQSLELLNLKWDEYYVQSERLDIYSKYLDVLKEKDVVYEDEGAWRFKVPQGKVFSWEDGVHGKVEFKSEVIEDFIIVKSDKFPTYHFANVVDDHDMKISHVMRGDEWLPSTPKHLALYEAFGWQPPTFVHMPVILGHDHKKLSKREGAKSVMEFVDEGYLPEAIVNFLAFLGWAPKDNREIFSLGDLSREFSIDRINKNSPIFNIEKLKWFNSQWIRRLTEEELTRENYFKDFKKSDLETYLPLVKDRMGTLADFRTLTSGFFKEPDPRNLPDLLVERGTISNVSLTYEKIPPSKWNVININNATTSVMESENLTKPDLFRSIGIATLGSTVTPPLMESLEKLGKEKTVLRLKNVVNSSKAASKKVK